MACMIERTITDLLSPSQFHLLNRYELRHAWLNLWDEHMTTGRINQIVTESHCKHSFSKHYPNTARSFTSHSSPFRANTNETTTTIWDNHCHESTLYTPPYEIQQYMRRRCIVITQHVTHTLHPTQGNVLTHLHRTTNVMWQLAIQRIYNTILLTINRWALTRTTWIATSRFLQSLPFTQLVWCMLLI